MSTTPKSKTLPQHLRAARFRGNNASLDRLDELLAIVEDAFPIAAKAKRQPAHPPKARAKPVKNVAPSDAQAALAALARSRQQQLLELCETAIASRDAGFFEDLAACIRTAEAHRNAPRQPSTVGVILSLAAWRRQSAGKSTPTAAELFRFGHSLLSAGRIADFPEDESNFRKIFARLSIDKINGLGR